MPKLNKANNLKVVWIGHVLQYQLQYDLLASHLAGVGYHQRINFRGFCQVNIFTFFVISENDKHIKLLKINFWSIMFCTYLSSVKFTQKQYRYTAKIRMFASNLSLFFFCLDIALCHFQIHVQFISNFFVFKIK